MFDYRDALDSYGLIAKKRPGYERRESQLEMAREVEVAIRERRCLTVEAGTGVGKSFAYLVPAILYVVEDQVREYSREADDSESASENGAAPPRETESSASNASEPERVVGETDEWEENDSDSKEMRRVVVSTHTISLQEQLFEKDVPFLNSILPFEFTAALAKGRANYLCRRRFAAAAKGAANGTLFETDRQKEFRRLKEWLQKTTDGSKSELSPQAPPEVWNEICCERGNCLGRQCPFRDSCFHIRAKRRLENAQLVIVNHALLFSDLAVRKEGGSILPSYDVLIFDEAHTMEQVAAEHLGVELTQSAVDYLLTRLYNDRTNRGLLVEERENIPDFSRQIFINAARQVDECRYRAEEFFHDLNDWLDERPGSNGRVFDKNIVSNGLSEGLAILKSALRACSDALEEPSRRQEYIAARDRVDAFLSTIDDWLEQRAEGFVYWLERTNGRGGAKIAMRAAPVDVAPILRQYLFNAIPTVIAASATLTTGTVSRQKKRRVAQGKGVEPSEPKDDSESKNGEEESEETKRAFGFFRRRVGLTGARARALGSPFDYREQMTLVLAKGLELSETECVRRGIPVEERAETNERRLLAALREYIEETDGGVFALFTNASQMKRATDALSPWLAENDYPFFSQSEGTPRIRMVQMFKETTRGVLFGVDSFWQGVDVPGAALRNVIIVKIPFLAPEQPLVEARLEAIEKYGGSPFRDYQLPTAILKFKQGVGRLIRTKTDVGQVVVLDERIRLKSYGREFLRALPDCKLRVDAFE